MEYVYQSAYDYDLLTAKGTTGILQINVMTIQ